MSLLPDNSESEQLFEIADQLRGERPQADAGMLDRVWRRASTRAVERRRLARFRRLAIATLATGLFATGGGAAVAISGLSSPGGDAAQVVYPDTTGTQGGVLGDTQSGTETEATLGNGEVLGKVQSGSDGEAGLGAQQVTATSESDGLPFTGLAAIPLLLLGGAMLVVGGVLLRRLQHSRS